MPRKQGFAALTPERQREIATLGGRASQASGRGHRFTTDEAREAGRKGGKRTAKDHDHMVAIGRKGGSARARKQPEPLPGVDSTANVA